MARTRTIGLVKTRPMSTQSRTTHPETTYTDTGAARRLLRAIDRGTLVTMNAPATLRIAAQGGPVVDNGATDNRATDHGATDNQEKLMSIEAVPSPELEHELTVLREASVWQLNAAIEAGFVDEVDNISDSYAAAERSLLRRWRANAA